MTWRPRYSWRTLIIATVLAGCAVGLLVRRHYRKIAAEDFWGAVVSRDAEAVRWCVRMDPRLANSRDPSGSIPALGRAVLARDIEMMKVLLDAGAFVDAGSEIGRTPLQFAAESGEIEMARLLLRCGADVNAADDVGISALHLATLAGPRMCEVLIAAGAGLEARDGNGRSPIDWASNDGNEAVVKLLRSRGARERTAGGATR